MLIITINKTYTIKILTDLALFFQNTDLDRLKFRSKAEQGIFSRYAMMNP